MTEIAHHNGHPRATPVGNSATDPALARGSAAREEGPVVVIDGRCLVSQCLLTSLRLADPGNRFETYPGLAEWQAEDETGPAGLVVLCSGGGHTDESEAVEVRRKLEQIRAIDPDVPVAVLSDRETPDRVKDILGCGVRGYVPTSTRLEVVVQAFQLIRAGGVYVPASVLAAVALADAGARPQPAEGSLEQFSPQQLRVARALRRGVPNKLIAYQLNMCESTVKVHVRNIMKKTKAKNRTEVAFLINRYFGAEDKGCGGA